MPYLLHSSGLLPTVTRRKLPWLAYGGQPLGVLEGTVKHHATGASEIVHRRDGAHGDVLRYGAVGRVPGDKHAAEVGSLSEPRYRPQSVP